MSSNSTTLSLKDLVEKETHGGARTPGDATSDFIRNLANSDDATLDEDDAADTPDYAPTSSYQAAPSVISRVLASPARGELLAIASLLDPDNIKRHTIVFHTPIGEVRCAVDWVGNEPSKILVAEGLIIVKVRTSDVTFRPSPGATCKISFLGYAGSIQVTCLEAPLTMYPGVDLLCFLPHTSRMEKSGVLNERTPSAVSGSTSDRVDENGEAVVGLEKSAGVEDFDRARAEAEKEQV